MQAELTMQGVDTVDAFWMALERTVHQKVNPMEVPLEPAGTSLVRAQGRDVVPGEATGEVAVYTERATVDMSTGTVSYRPVVTVDEATAIRKQLETLRDAGKVDDAFVQRMMEMTKGEGVFAGVENRHLGSAPHGFSNGIQSMAIPKRAVMTESASAELNRFAETLAGGDVAKVPGIRADMDWQISISTLRYLPEIFRSPKLRKGVAKRVVDSAIARMSPADRVALPSGFGKQAEKTLGRLLSRSAGRVGPLSGEPGSMLPLLLDIDFPGTGIRINTADFANVLLNSESLRKTVLADAMQQSAMRYGIREAQRTRQDALVDAVGRVDDLSLIHI